MKLYAANIFSTILYAAIYIIRIIIKKGITLDFPVLSYRRRSIRPSQLHHRESHRKQKDLVWGFMQNIMQLESSHQQTREKESIHGDYLYGIVTTVLAS